MAVVFTEDLSDPEPSRPELNILLTATVMILLLVGQEITSECTELYVVLSCWDIYSVIFLHRMMMMPAPSARFLHTATFLHGGLMIVFGGNTHNDTAHSFGAKCYSSDMLAYDVACDSWSTLRVPQGLRSDLARFGHSATVFNNSLYIYGGFDGQMLSDMLR